MSKSLVEHAQEIGYLNTRVIAEFYGIKADKVRRILNKAGIKRSRVAGSRYFWTPIEVDKIQEVEKLFRNI